jgi:hypothetical protein
MPTMQVIHVPMLREVKIKSELIDEIKVGFFKFLMQQVFEYH